MKSNAPTKYRVFELAGQPILALPIRPRRLRFRGLDRFQPYSPRRAAYRSFMRTAMRLGADRLLGRSTQTIPSPDAEFDVARWLAAIGERLGRRVLIAAIVWPPQPDRHRLYAHLCDETHAPVGFAKIAFDDENRRDLDHEASTLRMLEKLRVDGYHTPRVLHTLETGPFSTVIQEPLPPDARPVVRDGASYPDRFVDAIADPDRFASGEEIRATPWWQECTPDLQRLAPRFAEGLGTALDSAGARVCRIHGDLTCANLSRSGAGAETWVLDWEASLPDGPRLTDPVSFHLDARFIRSARNPRAFAGRFGAEYVRHQVDAGPAEVMLGLAFRYWIGSRSATACIVHWDAVREGAS